MACGRLEAGAKSCPMGRKPSQKPDDPVQSKRFIETAEQVGADEDEKALERAFERVKGTTKVKSRDRP